MLGDTLNWPFFEETHRRFAAELSRWADAALPSLPHDDVDAACRTRVKALGEARFLDVVVPRAYGGAYESFDVRALCLAREILG
jgi:acyl-CoA dehydrogenase